MSTSRRAKTWATVGVATVVLSGLSAVGPGSAVAAPPAPPTSLAPNSKVDVRKDVELTWASVAGATSYEVQLLDDADADLARVLTRKVDVPRWTVPTSLPTGEYRWRVRAYTKAAAGGWSSLATLERGWNARTTLATQAPGQNEILPVLSWNPIVDSSFYEVEINPKSFFSPTYSAAASFRCWTNQTTFAPYAVAAGADFGEPAGNESSCAFTAESPPSGTADAPTDKYLIGQQYFWRVRGRDGTVNTDPTPFPASAAACVGPWVESGVTITETTGLVTVPLPTKPPAAEPTPECSRWSAEQSFVPKMPRFGLVGRAPTGLMVGPLGANSTQHVTTTPTFRWNATPNALKYRFYLSRDPQIGSVDFAAETQSTAFTPVSSLDLGSTTRYWAIQACGLGRVTEGDGQCGPISQPQPISLVTQNRASPSSLTAPQANYLLAQWSPGAASSSAAKYYAIRLTNTETGVSTTTSTDRLSNNLTGGKSTLVIRSSQLVEGRYVFQVRPFDQAGRTTSWSRQSKPFILDRTASTVGLTSKPGFVDRVAVTLTFNEPVVNVSAATTGVMLSTGAKVKGALTRRSATTFSFVPATPWVTGAYTRAWATGVVDRAGKRTVASTRSIRAGLTADSAGQALGFTAGDRGWSTRSSSDAFRSTFRATLDDPRTARRGSVATTVYGSAVTVGFCRTPSSGSLGVYVDGRLRATVSLYRGWTGCANAVRVAGLARGTHRVVLIPVATSRGSYAAIDRVSVS